MILVEVTVPMLDLTFDFRLEESALVEDATEEIADVVCRYAQRPLAGNREDLILCKPSRHKIFSAGMTLAECGLRTGDRLMLM